MPQNVLKISIQFLKFYRNLQKYTEISEKLTGTYTDGQGTFRVSESVETKRKLFSGWKMSIKCLWLPNEIERKAGEN